MVLRTDDVPPPPNMAVPSKHEQPQQENGFSNGAAAEVLWRHPDPESTPMWRFIQHVNEKYGLRLEGYPGLYKWSIENVAQFWEEVWHFVGIKASKPFEEVCSAICYACGDLGRRRVGMDGLQVRSMDIKTIA